ncbi:hypothetical protein BGV71_07365 [Burkholderia ubonensis]|nr:hypothetical protein WM10_12670 [Burkholderia ubonensis]KWK11626.1 hypothetical protein WM11_03300 [Burkholderia ubonensis]KWK14986.1 hypothetical protein WM12_07260 [Burkholderia ubonensis]KWK37211.1 hypothetical protein WM13_24625 [Burkholderia ubonensis]KWK38655.1 hypothetical protein WM14_22915 [Burkholderia ubonensis]
MMSLYAAALFCFCLARTRLGAEPAGACGRPGMHASDQSRSKSDNLPMKYWIEGISISAFV